LTLATELALTPNQKARTEALFESMESEAIVLGNQLIKQERELDMLRARPSRRKRCSARLKPLACCQGALRQVHLRTHLAQAEILDAEQIRKYD